MSAQNVSRKSITEFVFKGFDTVEHPLAIGVVMLFGYILALLANITNMFIIIVEKRLHQPMYFFICHLSFVDLIYSSCACPTMIGILVFGSKTISYAPCIVQMFLFHLSMEMEMFTICMMAFDRIIAIARPLKYSSLLTNLRCVLTIVVLWIVGCAIMTMLPATAVPLPICYSEVKYTFCDYATVMRATCSNPEGYFNNSSILTLVLIFGTLSFVCFTYVRIFVVIVKMPTKNNKRKALNTCLSHFMVVICFYVPLFIRVILTRIGVILTLEERNALMVGSILVPSLCNPFIYCFKTREIRNKLFKKFVKNT